MKVEGGDKLNGGRWREVKMVEGGHKLKWWKVERSQEGGRWRQVKMVEGGKKSRRWKRGGKLKWWKVERSQEGGSAEAVFLSFDGQCSAVGGLTWNAVLNIS